MARVPQPGLSQGNVCQRNGSIPLTNIPLTISERLHQNMIFNLQRQYSELTHFRNTGHDPALLPS